MQALHEAAAKLPRIAIQRPERNRVVGTDTVTAMQSGVFWGYISLIEGLIAKIKAERGEHLTVVATGGVVSLFEGATEAIDVFDPDLTIRGLLEIHRRNTHLQA
jgi:type III pantothenate kinase